MLGALVLAVAPATARANGPAQPPDCSVEDAAGGELLDLAKRMGRTAELLLPIQEEQLAITQRAKPSNDYTPLKDLLTPEDTLRFEVLREKSLPLTLAETIDSARDRDIRVVVAMSSMAWQTYKNPVKETVLARFMRCTDAEKQSQQCKVLSEEQPGEAIFVARMIAEEPNISLPSIEPSGCNVDSALVAQQKRAIRLGTQLVDTFKANDEPTFERLKAKYDVRDGKLPTDKMNAGDKQIAHKISLKVTEIQRALQLIYDTANIRGFWAASELVYQSRLEDAHTYGTDGASFGKTQQRKLEESDNQTKLMFGLWRIVDFSLPSEQDKVNASNAAIAKQSLETIKKHKAAPQ
jgi:hypothetical protein